MEFKLFSRPVKKKREKITPLAIVIVTFLILYCVVLLTLLIWGLIASFKEPNTDFRVNPIGLPKEWITKNYESVYWSFTIDIQTPTGVAYVTFPMLFLYGFIYALGCAFVGTLVPCITSYLCAKFDYKFSKLIYLIVIVTMILPIVGNLPSEIQMAKTFGLYNSIWGVWVLKANFLGLYFIVFYNYFRSIPNAYIEAARIDGASNLRILLRVILPMARPIFMTVMLITFISFWNDYQTPLIYMESYPTIAVGLYNIVFQPANQFFNVPCQMAAASLMLVPVLIIFLLFHKKLLGNLTMGGIKG